MRELLRNAPVRLVRSFFYSWDGFKAILAKEEAFRLECLAFVLLLGAMLAVPWPAWKKVAMVACYLLIPLTEAVNSAIEDVCDMATREFSPYVKAAKDKGSLAVLFAIILNALALVALILM